MLEKLPAEMTFEQMRELLVFVDKHAPVAGEGASLQDHADTELMVPSLADGLSLEGSEQLD